MDKNKLVGMKGGKDGTFWEIVAIEDEGETSYYPAVVDGQERSYFDFKSLEDYSKHKVKKTRQTVRYIVAGNPVSAESALQAKGIHCMSTLPQRLDVYQ